MSKSVWFIEPKDTPTKKAVQQAIDEILNQATEPTKIPGVINPVWESPTGYAFVKFLQNSKNDQYLSFWAYIKTGDVVRRYRLHETEIRKLSRKRMVNTKKAHIPRSKYTQPQRKGGL